MATANVSFMPHFFITCIKSCDQKLQKHILTSEFDNLYILHLWWVVDLSHHETHVLSFLTILLTMANSCLHCWEHFERSWKKLTMTSATLSIEVDSPHGSAPKSTPFNILLSKHLCGLEVSPCVDIARSEDIYYYGFKIVRELLSVRKVDAGDVTNWINHSNSIAVWKRLPYAVPAPARTL